jgi:hypothetical protein
MISNVKHGLVSDKSSIDLIGIFVAILRERFNQVDPSFPWKWDKDSSLSKIFIDAGGVDTYDSNDARSGIFVDRSSIAYQKMVLNDMADYDSKSAARSYFCRAMGQMAIDCVSKNRGESSTLGDICATHLLMSDDIFRAVFDIQDISPITLGNTQPWEKDDRVFVSRVTCEFTYDLSWRWKPPINRLEKIKSYIIPE